MPLRTRNLVLILCTLIFVPLLYAVFNGKHEIRVRERKRRTRAQILLDQEGLR